MGNLEKNNNNFHNKRCHISQIIVINNLEVKKKIWRKYLEIKNTYLDF